MKNYLKKNIFITVLVAFVILLPFISFADPLTGGSTTDPLTGDAPTGSVKIVNPIKVDSIYGLIKVILEGVIKIGIPIVALAIIYSGFLFVAARGKPEELKKAKNALLYTIIGAAILLGSWAIAQLISDTVLAL
ncbi:pilin [Patescibacteria group bacterium]|nr:pilin [Patescibacteria group bacterium]MBU1728099.1 pilin [Patescibacteria group bacterium]